MIILQLCIDVMDMHINVFKAKKHVDLRFGSYIDSYCFYGHSLIPFPLHRFLGLHPPWRRSGVTQKAICYMFSICFSFSLNFSGFCINSVDNSSSTSSLSSLISIGLRNRCFMMK